MENLTLIPFGLSGQIYRCPMPFGSFDLGHSTLAEMQSADINTVVMLIDHDEDRYHAGRDLAQLYRQQGWQVYHLPVMDFDVPEKLQDIRRLVETVYRLAVDGKKVAVHCNAGRGRTGMFLSLLARRILDMDGNRAVEWLRQFFPAVETDEQIRLVVEIDLDGDMAVEAGLDPES